MRKRISILLCVWMVLGMTGSLTFADTWTTGSAVLPVSGPGVQVRIQGSITPTIMSVTMPSDISFDIGKSNAGENKVVSPEIVLENRSDTPVSVYAKDTLVDLSRLPGAQYAAGTTAGSLYPTIGGIYVPDWGRVVTVGAVQIQEHELIIGFSDEMVPTQGAVMPGLSQARWLVEGEGTYPEGLEPVIATIPANDQQRLHVVGMIGRNVPENQTFTVTPTLIVRPQW